MMTGPADGGAGVGGGAWIPPTAQPLVGESMKMEVRFAADDKPGVPLTVTKFHVPTPPLTV